MKCLSLFFFLFYSSYCLSSSICDLLSGKIFLICSLLQYAGLHRYVAIYSCVLGEEVKEGVLWVITSAQRVLLVLCSGFIPGSSWGTICSARMEPGWLFAGKHLYVLSYLGGPSLYFCCSSDSVSVSLYVVGSWVSSKSAGGPIVFWGSRMKHLYNWIAFCSSPTLLEGTQLSLHSSLKPWKQKCFFLRETIFPMGHFS